MDTVAAIPRAQDSAQRCFGREHGLAIHRQERSNTADITTRILNVRTVQEIHILKFHHFFFSFFRS